MNLWEAKSRRRRPNITVLVFVVLVLVILFAYTRLNLETIDSGYQMQDLLDKEKRLREEIDKLQAARARQLNLENVDKVARQSLGLQPPQAQQVVKVFEVAHAR